MLDSTLTYVLLFVMMKLSWLGQAKLFWKFLAGKCLSH